MFNSYEPLRTNKQLPPKNCLKLFILSFILVILIAIFFIDQFNIDPYTPQLEDQKWNRNINKEGLKDSDDSSTNDKGDREDETRVIDSQKQKNIKRSSVQPQKKQINLVGISNHEIIDKADSSILSHKQNLNSKSLTENGEIKLENFEFCFVSVKTLPQVDGFLTLVDSLFNQKYAKWKLYHYSKDLSQIQLNERVKVLDQNYHGDNRISFEKSYMNIGKDLYDGINNKCSPNSIVILLNEGEYLLEENTLLQIRTLFSQNHRFYILASSAINSKNKKIMPNRKFMKFVRFRDLGDPVNQVDAYENVLSTFKIFKQNTFVNVIPWDLLDVWTEEFYESPLAFILPLLEMHDYKEQGYDKQLQMYGDLAETYYATNATYTNLTFFKSLALEYYPVNEESSEICLKFKYHRRQNLYAKARFKRKNILWPEQNKRLNFLDRKVDKTQKLIPRNLHQIWIGENDMNQRQKKICEINRQIHEGYEYKLWTQKDITKQNFPNTYKYIMKALEIDKEYEFSRLSSVSDLMRYQILYHHGGIYLDVNYEVFRSYEQLRYARIVVNYEHADVNYFSNGIIAAQKHSHIMRRLISPNKLSKIDFLKETNLETGPYYLGSAFTIEDIFFNIKLLPGNIVLPYIPFLADTRYHTSKCLFPIEEVPEKFVNYDGKYIVKDNTMVSLIPCREYESKYLGMDHFEEGGAWHRHREGLKTEQQMRNQQQKNIHAS